MHNNDIILLTRAQVAKRLNVSLHKAGAYMLQMPCVILPSGRKRVTEETLSMWIREHTFFPAEKPERQKRTKQRDSLLTPEGKMRRRTA